MSKLLEDLELLLGSSGRLITASKGRYRYNNPQNIVVYNANLVTTDGVKLWHGDLDLTLDFDILAELAKKHDVGLCVLPEMAARFENETAPKMGDTIVEITESGCSWKKGIPIVKKANKFYREIPKETVLPEYEDGKYIEADYLKLEMPLDFIKVTAKGEEPLTQLYNKIAAHLQLNDLSHFNVSKIVVNNDTEAKLIKLVESYAKKSHKISGYDLQKAVTWHMFDLGPQVFQGSKKGPSWVIENYIYVNKAWLEEIRGRIN